MKGQPLGNNSETTKNFFVKFSLQERKRSVPEFSAFLRSLEGRKCPLIAAGPDEDLRL